MAGKLSPNSLLNKGFIEKCCGIVEAFRVGSSNVLKRRLFSAVLVWLFSFPLLAHAEQSLLVSIKPLGLLVKALMPEKTVQVLVPDNRNLHDYRLSIADLSTLQASSGFIWLGAKQEPFLAKLESRFAKENRWFAVADGHAHPWLEPEHLPVLIRQLATVLVTLHPQQATKINNNADALIAGIQQSMSEWKARLAPLSDKSFLMGHSAFEGFAEALGLEHPVLYRSGSSHGHHHGGMHELLDIQKAMAEKSIRCALEEPDVHFDGLRKRYPHLQLAMVMPMASNVALEQAGFLQFINKTAEAFERCLTVKDQ